MRGLHTCDDIDTIHDTPRDTLAALPSTLLSLKVQVLCNTRTVRSIHTNGMNLADQLA